MSFYTVTDNATNEILHSFETTSVDLVSLQNSAGRSIHEGHYPASEYLFDGVDFVELPNKPTKPLISQDVKVLLNSLIRDLKKSGYTLEIHRETVSTKQDARDLIDQAASRACERFVSQGKFTIVEYQLTQQQVKDWRDAGSDEANPPDMLLSWFENSDFETLELAAQNIEETASGFIEIIETTRRIRLEGKKAVSASSDYMQVMSSYIAQLEALRI